jgi:hypothetical protein
MPQLKPGNEKKPSPGTLVPISYAPPNSVAHLIADGENWQTLAARYGLPAADIIKMNFKTTDAYEINWYLREYVNCNTPTPDGYNWRFSTSARNGPSPRAGKIFVIPNWTTILRAAKEATRDSVADWFRAALIRGAQVRGSELTVPLGSVSSVFTTRWQFTQRLRNGGASDQIAEKWANFLDFILRSYTADIHTVVPLAYPLYANWNAPTPPPPMPATPFLLLQGTGGESYVSRGFLRPQLQQYLGNAGDPAATTMANGYSVWFADKFALFRASAKVMHMLATVYKIPGQIVSGDAFAPPGSITVSPMLL